MSVQSEPVRRLIREEVLEVLRRSHEDLRVFKAASALGSRPKHINRQWTGWLGRVHLWRGRHVVTPTGQVAEIVAAVRGRVLVKWHDPNAIEDQTLQLFKKNELRVHKMPAAVFLGRRKLGTKEKSSVLKAMTSRANGGKPPRRGSRPRGRPRKGGGAGC